MAYEQRVTNAEALNATLIKLWGIGAEEGVAMSDDTMDIVYLATIDGPLGVYTFAPEILGLRKRAKGSDNKAAQDTATDVLQMYESTVGNEDFYRFFDVKRNDFVDDKIGRYAVAAKHFGVMSGRQPTLEVQDLIANGAASTSLCYDGKPFFATDHPIDPSRPSAGTFSNKITKSAGLTLDTFAEVVAEMEGIKSDDGIAGTSFPSHILVPPAYRGIADDIAYSEKPSSLSGGNNKWLRYGFRVIVVPKWAGQDIWALVDARSSYMRPFVYQEREKIRLVQMYTDPDMGWVLENGIMRWGIVGRGAAGYGYPRKAVLVTK